jgi:hypothetical protein
MLVSADLELTIIIIISGLATWELICVVGPWRWWTSFPTEFRDGYFFLREYLSLIPISNRVGGIYILFLHSWMGIYFLLLYFTVLPVVVEYHPVLLEAPCACTIRPHPITGQRVQGLQQFRAPRHLHAQKPIQMTVNCCIVYCVFVLPKGNQNTEVYVLFAKTKYHWDDECCVSHRIFFFPPFRTDFVAHKIWESFGICFFLV